MQKHIPVPDDVLLDLLAHAAAASRQLGLIEEQSVVLAAGAALLDVDHIGRTIAGLVGHSAAPFGRKPSATGAADEIDDGGSSKFDDLRIAVAKVDALASASEDLFDNTMWGGQVDRQRLERAAHLIGATREAAEAALNAVDAFNADALNPTITADGKSEPETW